MTYLDQAEIPSSWPAEERAGLHPPRLRGLDLDLVRRLRPRLDHCRHHRGLFRALGRAAPGGEDLRHRLLVEDADLFPRQLARLQLGARPHAVGADRRQPRQPRPDLSRRVGRRRLRLDRLRPVRPRDPARRQHGLYRREQRRIRPHQGAVLGHRRPRLEVEARRHQRRQRDRHGGDRAPARRDLCGAFLLGRQGTARAADQGRDRARGRGLHRRDLAVRRLQQPRRLDQELRLRARAQRGGQPARRHHRPRPDQDRLCAGLRAGGRAARRLASWCCASSTPTTT